MWLTVAAAVAFSVWGAASERIASVWPPDEASRRGPGPRTVLLAIAAGAAGAGIAWRSELPLPVTLVHLAFLAALILLVATDLEQRRLPHLVLDPLIVAAVAFVPFNPTVSFVDAVIGAVSAFAFMALLGVIVRGGVARGDLYLVLPLGLLLGWQGVFVALFVAGLLAALTSGALLVTRRVGLRSYIPFGPFLVAGAVFALLRDPGLLGAVGAAWSG